MRYFDYIRARVLESSDLSIRMKLQLERSDWNTNTFTLTYALTNEEIATLVNMLQHQNDTLIMRNLFLSLRFHDSNRIPRVVRLGSSSVYAVDAEILEYRDVAVLSFLSLFLVDPTHQRRNGRLELAHMALLLRGKERNGLRRQRRVLPVRGNE